MKRKYWTKTEVEKLSDTYPHHPTKELTEIFNRSATQIYNKAFSLGYKKSKETLDKNRQKSNINLIEGGIRTRFKKGDVPHTKGRKQIEWMSGESIERSKTTRFKKGKDPHNAYELGTIVVRHRKDRNEPPHKWIKVDGKRALIPLHHHIWEQSNGPKPSGHNIAFMDGDTLNCELSNLEMISNAELMNRNTINRYPIEVKEVIRAINKLNKTIKNVKKDNT